MARSVPQGRTLVAQASPERSRGDAVLGTGNRETVVSLGGTTRLGLADWALLAMSLASLITCCVLISPRKFFWNDEIIAWKMITDSSVKHMLWAVAHGCDGAPPEFHLLLRAWSNLFGTGELALRFFSCAGFCVALVALWVTLRRHFRVEAVAFGILSIWFTTRTLMNEVAEARNYGLYIAFLALSLAFLDRVANQDSPSRRTMVALFAVTVALVYSHYFGILYSGLMLAVLIGWDLSRRVRRPAIYLSVIAGWLPLVFWLPAILREQANFRERNYYAVLNWREVSEMYTSFRPALPLLLLTAICVLMLLLFRRSGEGQKAARLPASFAPLIAIAGLFVLVLAAFYVLSQFIHVPHADRYFLPNALAYSILIAWGADRIVAKLTVTPRFAFSRPALFVAWIAVFVAILANGINYARHWIGGITPIFFQVNRFAPPGIPVVIEDVHQWMQANYYDHSRPYIYVLDRDIAMAPDTPVTDSFTFHEKTHWKEAGYWSDRLLTTDELLCRYRQFGVVDDDIRWWFKRRIEGNPLFDVGPLRNVRFARFAVVTRKPDATLPACAGSR